MGKDESGAGEAEALVTRACGLELHLAPSNSTGYKGVCWHKGANKYHAFRGYGPGSSLGYFATAVDAAVAYARKAAGRPA